MPNGGRAGAVERVRNRPVEPARFDEPAATPAAVAGQVAGARSYTNDQLAAMLRAAHEALPGLVTGDLNDPAVQRTKGVSYQRLCDLAEAVTFAQQPVVSGGAMSSAGQEEDAAQALFRETLREPKVRGEVARIAPLWIATPQRRHGGVFFAGSVVSSAQRGPVMECRVETGAGEPIIILVPAALREQLDRADGALAIVGSLVDQPSDHVAGYTGSAPQAVWVGMLIPLD
jgi:hypothetical protein